MIAGKKNLLINICLALVSVGCSLGAGYYLYNYIKKPQSSIFLVETKEEYLFSLYNRQGEKVSDVEGSLKLVTDPFTIYQNYPNQKMSKYSINDYGFRDTYTSDKRHTAIVIGSSAAFGFALDSNDQTFASNISRNNEKYNIINAAVIGFLSGQELSQMVHYLDEFHPQLYIIFNGWNDIYDPIAYTKSVFKERSAVYQSPIGYNNAFLNIERRMAEYFQMGKKLENSQIIPLSPVGKPLREEELFQEILNTYTTNISRMHDFASARGARALVVFQPELGNKKNRSSSEEKALRTWIENYGYLDNKISERYKKLINEAKIILEGKNIIYLDINDIEEFRDNPQALFFDVVHPNELGHKIIAKIINQVLLERF